MMPGLQVTLRQQKMKPDSFIDSSVFIYAKESKQSNSAIILELISTARLEAVISPRVVMEVFHYFKKHYGKQATSN